MCKGVVLVLLLSCREFACKRVILVARRRDRDRDDDDYERRRRRRDDDEDPRDRRGIVTDILSCINSLIKYCYIIRAVERLIF